MNKYLEIIEKAKEAREKSYSPYSKFKVGAAILLADGTYILGTNVENVSYGLTSCAERNAIFSLISQGYDIKNVKLFCIIGDTNNPITPCGACRQVMAEFFNGDLEVVLANLKADYKVVKLKELLPYGFEGIENV